MSVLPASDEAAPEDESLVSDPVDVVPEEAVSVEVEPVSDDDVDPESVPVEAEDESDPVDVVPEEASDDTSDVS